MKNQPNIFIIGAPKCGTSSLASWLASHNDIFLPEVKEPHYYNTDQKHRFYTTRKAYLKLFEEGENHKYRLDASTWYLHSKEAVKNILNDCPEAKFIVCLRNPVDMAFSLHNHFLQRSCREHIKSFSAAWDMSDQRLEGLEINSLVTEPTHLAYKYSCMLGSQCERLLELVPKSKVHFVIFDDLVSRQEDVLSELLTFLELMPNITLELPHNNQSIKRRSLKINRLIRTLSSIKSKLGINFSSQFVGKALEKINSTNEKYEVDPHVRSMVTSHFRGDVEKIFEITGVYREKWLS